jgi:hypothetical protein
MAEDGGSIERKFDKEFLGDAAIDSFFFSCVLTSALCSLCVHTVHPWAECGS